ncbi:MAG: VIT domain-containing protein [Armatimonadota bacterium]
MEHVETVRRDPKVLEAIQTAVNSPAKPPAKPLVGWVVMAFGIVLPLLALAAEMVTHAWRGILFDMFPTVWHVLLFATIAVGNGLAVWGVKHCPARFLHWLGLPIGIALGVTIWYTLQTIVLVPFALLAIFVVLLFPPVILFSLFALCPLLAFIATLCNRSVLKKHDALAKKWAPELWGGLGLALSFLLLLEAPGAFTEAYMERAASDNPKTSIQAVSWLRHAGNRQVMLRRCYERPQTGAGFLSMLLGGGEAVPPEEARTIYYRVTGQTFNSIPAPVNLGNRRGMFDETERDRDQGGDRVAGKVPGLTLQSSQLDGSVDADAALAYLQWTLAFKNATSTAHEARMQIALPPGAVVSRLTLWVNGEEREAAFSARGLVRQAYQEVAIVQQRDPVLVTTCGPDRVLVQCFPVPANGGVMKIRLGITAPLMLDTPDKGLLALPHMVEQNFASSTALRHRVWLESKRQASALLPGLHAEQAGNGVHAVRGEITDSAFARLRSALQFSRNPAVVSAWTPDAVNPRRALIRERIARTKGDTFQRIILVIDGSRCMRESIPALIRGLESLPTGREFAVLLAGDNVHTVMPLQTVSPAACASTMKALQAARFDGGMDNVLALVSAWELAARHPSSAILWIHGPQPSTFASIDGLTQRWERRPDGPRLFALEAIAGDNAPLRALDRMPAVHNVPRLGTLTEDMARLLTGWSGSPQLRTTLERVNAADWRNRTGSKETSSHLSRLWAQRQVMKRYALRGQENTEMAIAIAKRYQLVTPVTGAVVLETTEQYRDAGLEPVPAGTVPTVPEPEVWMLLLVAAGVLGYAIWKRRRACLAS